MCLVSSGLRRSVWPATSGLRRSVWPGTSRRAGTVRIGWGRRVLGCISAKPRSKGVMANVLGWACVRSRAARTRARACCIAPCASWCTRLVEFSSSMRLVSMEVLSSLVELFWKLEKGCQQRHLCLLCSCSVARIAHHPACRTHRVSHGFSWVLTCSLVVCSLVVLLCCTWFSCAGACARRSASVSAAPRCRRVVLRALVRACGACARLALPARRSACRRRGEGGGARDHAGLKLCGTWLFSPTAPTCKATHCSAAATTPRTAGARQRSSQRRQRWQSAPSVRLATEHSWRRRHERREQRLEHPRQWEYLFLNLMEYIRTGTALATHTVPDTPRTRRFDHSAPCQRSRGFYHHPRSHSDYTYTASIRERDWLLYKNCGTGRLLL